METFKVGDKVVRNYNSRFNGYTDIGVVTKVTQKRKDVTVEYGNYSETYYSDGWEKTKNRRAWQRSHINILTPEIEKDLKEKKLIKLCISTFEKKSKELTAEQAKQILDVLEK